MDSMFKNAYHLLLFISREARVVGSFDRSLARSLPYRSWWWLPIPSHPIGFDSFRGAFVPRRKSSNPSNPIHGWMDAPSLVAVAALVVAVARPRCLITVLPTAEKAATHPIQSNRIESKPWMDGCLLARSLEVVAFVAAAVFAVTKLRYSYLPYLIHYRTVLPQHRTTSTYHGRLRAS
eukprot:jgi/Psemu1/303399/fgenesh1_kg.103_\